LRHHVCEAEHIHYHYLRCKIILYLSIAAHEDQELKSPPVEDFDHYAAYSILKEGSKALKRRPCPTEPHAFEETLRVKCDPEVQQHHIEDVGDISSKSSSDNTPLELYDEEVAAYDLHQARHNLDETWHEAIELCRQKAFGCVELAHGPHSWHAHDAVLDGDLAYKCVLTEESDQDLISEHKKDGCRENHIQRID
jgi:hypothetical protein